MDKLRKALGGEVNSAQDEETGIIAQVSSKMVNFFQNLDLDNTLYLLLSCI